tara:strand:+ start:356 stop:1090 length:735 start_codon:yes stop_codon:yes gene_type:complete
MKSSSFVFQITWVLFSTGSLLAQPSISVSPISLLSSLNTGETGPQVLNITNTGDEALEWDSNIVNTFNNRFYVDRIENIRALISGNANNTDTRVKLLGHSFVPVVETIRTRDVSIALIKEFDPWDSPGNEMVLQHSFVSLQSLYISKENTFLFSNYNKNLSIKNWFYFMGPYNDTWGSDILKVHNAEGKRPISYYPFGNSALSFQSQHQNRYSNKNASVYLNILGFNLKKLQTSNAKHPFYGSE